MKKYSFMIPLPLLADIKEIAQRRDTTDVEVVREALTRLVYEERKKKPQFSVELATAATEWSK